MRWLKVETRRAVLEAEKLDMQNKLLEQQQGQYLMELGRNIAKC
jgi:hypothetical protein